MKSVAATCLCVSAVMLAFALEGGAQQRPADANDPRIGLKAGLHDAGEAARNMKRIASLPPLPSPDPNAAPTPAQVAQSNMLGFANSDLAVARSPSFSETCR